MLNPKKKKGNFENQLNIKYVKVINLNDNKVSAMKIIPKKQLEWTQLRRKILNEIKIHRELDHSNIVKLEHYFEDI